MYRDFFCAFYYYIYRMNVVFFDDEKRVDFLPLAYTKPLAKLRVGILTLEEKWEHYFKAQQIDYSISYSTEEYLSTKYKLDEQAENWFVNPRYIPTKDLTAFIANQLKNKEALYFNEEMIAAKVDFTAYKNKKFNRIDWEGDKLLSLETITDIFSKNEAVLLADFNLITERRTSQELSKTNTVIGDNIFIEEGAKVEASILNSSTGPIYIGKNAEVMEGSIVRGGLALCEGAVLKLGTKIYGATTIGKFSKVGGEVNNSVIQDYSNKGHDGFMGNSVIGEWCNLGADTNTSNLKNNYSEVKTWSYKTASLINSRLQFCGLIMGDHSKCGINTMFNTGTTIGVCSNIFDSGFPPKFIPSYSWGGTKGFDTYRLEKMFEVAEVVMARRSVDLTHTDMDIYTAIFEQTAKYRK